MRSRDSYAHARDICAYFLNIKVWQRGEESGVRVRTLSRVRACALCVNRRHQLAALLGGRASRLAFQLPTGFLGAVEGEWEGAGEGEGAGETGEVDAVGKVLQRIRGTRGLLVRGDALGGQRRTSRREAQMRTSI